MKKLIFTAAILALTTTGVASLPAFADSYSSQTTTATDGLGDASVKTDTTTTDSAGTYQHSRKEVNEQLDVNGNVQKSTSVKKHTIGPDGDTTEDSETQTNTPAE